MRSSGHRFLNHRQTLSFTYIDIALEIFLQIMIAEVITSNFLLGLFQGQQLKKMSVLLPCY